MPMVMIDRSNGRVMAIVDAAVGLSAIRIDGAWSPGVFGAQDLYDNFVTVSDKTEADHLLQEAAAVLSSSPSRPSAAPEASQ